MGDPRRRHPELQGGRQRLRAARRGVPRSPGRRTPRTSWPRSTSAARSARPSASPASASSSAASSTRSAAGARRTATSPPTQDAQVVRRRAHPPARQPEGRLQLAGLVQRRRARHAAAVLAPASSSPSTTTCPRSSTGTSRRARSSRAGRARASTCRRIRSSKEPLAGGGTASGPGQLHARRRRQRRHDQVRRQDAARREDGRSSTSTTPTSATSSGARPTRSSKARALRDAGFDMDLDGKDSYSIQYQNANNSVRVTDEFMQAVRGGPRLEAEGRHDRRDGRDGAGARPDARDRRRPRGSAPTPACSTTPRSTSGTRARPRAGSTRSNPCSEYMHLDNSACNLASLNLMKFLDDDGQLRRRQLPARGRGRVHRAGDRRRNSDYPTEKIGRNARAFRQLGLGYANLGALLMARGLAVRLRRRAGPGPARSPRS